MDVTLTTNSYNTEMAKYAFHSCSANFQCQPFDFNVSMHPYMPPKAIDSLCLCNIPGSCLHTNLFVSKGHKGIHTPFSLNPFPWHTNECTCIGLCLLWHTLLLNNALVNPKTSNASILSAFPPTG